MICHNHFTEILIYLFHVKATLLLMVSFSFSDKIKKAYTLSRNSSYTPSSISIWRGFDREPLKLQKQMIPHFLALDVGVKLCQAQLCSFFMGCHATFLLKKILFKEEVAWQPLIEVHSWHSDILKPTSRATKWSIICFCTLSGSLSNPLQRKSAKGVGED